MTNINLELTLLDETPFLKAVFHKDTKPPSVSLYHRDEHIDIMMTMDVAQFRFHIEEIKRTETQINNYYKWRE